LEECALFTNALSIDETAKEHLRAGGVTILPYEEMWSYLAKWGAQLGQSRTSGNASPEPQQPVFKDGESGNARPTYKASISGKTSWAVAEALGKVSLNLGPLAQDLTTQDNVDVGRSLVEDMKAQKNAVCLKVPDRPS
jgi:hypothetical protein